MVDVASAGVGEVRGILEDQYLLAPCDGQIDQVYPEEGELVSMGAPVMSLLRIADKWVTFTPARSISPISLSDAKSPSRFLPST